MTGVQTCALPIWDQLTYNISTNVIGIGLAMIFRFYAYRTWVFKDQAPDTEVVVPLEESSRVPDDRG